MNKYVDILDGKRISDILTTGGYTYYGYASGNDGSSGKAHTWSILRVNTAETEYRYVQNCSQKEAYSVAWARVTDLNYSRMDQIKTSQ